MMIYLIKKIIEKRDIQGFTLIETLIVLGIMALLMGIVTFSFSGIRARQSIDNETEAITALLKEARSRTLSSTDASVYGVNLQVNQATLFKGSSYNVGDSTNQTYVLSGTVRITAITLAGGGSDIIFDRLTGKTYTYGSLRVELVSDPTKVHTITVNPTGLVEND